MFFPERIKSISPGDKVLEIGPGGTPHPRSDVLLEKVFINPNEAEGQRGYTPALNDTSKVVYYEGGAFPFQDKQFDYIICSHVLEHVEDVDYFLSEITRVGSKGYLEFPTIYYDYIYNFPEHTTVIFHKNEIIYWMHKSETALEKFVNVQKLFYESLKSGHTALIESLKSSMFQGFEWFENIKTEKANSINDVTFDVSDIVIKPKNNKEKIIDVISILRSILYRN
jgi:2-polyprenyl-3-methyl-5-hydroxy-6-metoxy-1,4-benzoquinol methylase